MRVLPMTMGLPLMTVVIVTESSLVDYMGVYFRRGYKKITLFNV
jgi:hypothetical protein